MTVDTHPTMDTDVERRLGGVGPFVINLHASTAPIVLPAKSPVGGEQARLYRIQRVDDGRVRYRLRFGPFATEDEAEAVLAKVRLEYPCALLVTAAADDLHAIALVRGKTHPGDPPPDTHVTPAPPPAAATAAVAPAPAPAMAVAAIAPAPAPAMAVAAIAPAPAPAIAIAAIAAAPQPAVVSVASDIASMQALMAVIDTGFHAAPDNKTIKPPVLHTVPAAKKDRPLEPAALKATPRRDDARADTAAPSLESTQTLRPLTPQELAETARWFVVQLALSDDAFDPDALPHLDIFSLYRLYTVIGMDQGRLVHALRLGFFGEESGARAVASYLAAFYDEPIVKRVSVAERDRFAEQRVEARKDVGATGRHLDIEITNELVVRERRSAR
jgi:hypothetical protein